MRILVLHIDYFGDLWRAAGHETIGCGNNPTDDLKLPGDLVHIDRILSALGPSRVPDVIFWGDDSRFARVTGLERCPIPKVMWSIDTHHHADWHALYAQAFDLAFVAQSDFLPVFRQADVPTSWLPLYASAETIEPAPEDKLHDVCFVGTFDPVRNPERVLFINELGNRVRLHTASGTYLEPFRRSKIVINQTAKGDLNFRVFQALTCGSLLLTERTTNGLFDLFTEGVELVTYPRGDVDAAVAQIERYLADSDTRERIAAAGWEEVRRRHLRSHRAAFLLRVFEDLVAGSQARPRRDLYKIDVSMSLVYLHICHRMQEWSRVIHQISSPHTQSEHEQKRRRKLIATYLELARCYLDLARTRSPEDHLWREVAEMMRTQYEGILDGRPPGRE